MNISFEAKSLNKLAYIRKLIPMLLSNSPFRKSIRVSENLGLIFNIGNSEHLLKSFVSSFINTELRYLPFKVISSLILFSWLIFEKMFSRLIYLFILPYDNIVSIANLAAFVLSTNGWNKSGRCKSGFSHNFDFKISKAICCLSDHTRGVFFF